MTSRQTFFVLLGSVVALIGLAGFITYQGGQVLDNKGDDLLDKKLQAQVLAKREATLQQAKSDIERYTELEKIAKAIVPQEKDQALTVREITAIAQETGVPIASFQFPASALGEIKKGKGATQVNPDTSQLTPVEGTKGLYAMEITVQSASDTPVPYSSLLAFLEQLEQNRRTAHVVNLKIEPDANNRSLITFSVTLNVYIKP